MFEVRNEELSTRTVGCSRGKNRRRLISVSCKVEKNSNTNKGSYVELKTNLLLQKEMKPLMKAAF